MQTWKVKLELKVSDNWVSDGVNFGAHEFMDKFKEHIKEFLPYCYYDVEFKVDAVVVKSPSEDKIKELQGY